MIKEGCSYRYVLKIVVCSVLDLTLSGPCVRLLGIAGPQMDISGSVQVMENLSRFCSGGAKLENMVGQSRILVLVVGFSQFRALKKHAPFVFKFNLNLTVHG